MVERFINFTKMNEQYEQLKKVIQKANPEIMKLEFGCVVRDYSGDWQVLRKSYGLEDAIFAFNGTGTSHISWGEFEIFGRPIRLADVLLAADIYGENLAQSDLAQEKLFELLTDLWNLKDDNLDHQSDECKQFLIDLLTPQK